MTYKIGVVGAPSSGKTCLSARVHAEILERGINSCKLVTEFALDYLGMGNPIETLENQSFITDEQIQLEERAKLCNYNPIVCDSCIWIGKVYILHNNKVLTEDMQEYIEKVEKFKDLYDMTIYVPLFSKKSQLNTFRVHDSEAATELDKLIKTELKGAKNVIKAPKSLKDRESFIKYISGQIIDEIS